MGIAHDDLHLEAMVKGAVRQFRANGVRGVLTIETMRQDDDKPSYEDVMQGQLSLYV